MGSGLYRLVFHNRKISRFKIKRTSTVAGPRYVGDVHELANMIRFNEAFDQALVESITAYGKAVKTIEVESTREQSTIFRVALPVLADNGWLTWARNAAGKPSGVRGSLMGLSRLIDHLPRGAGRRLARRHGLPRSSLWPRHKSLNSLPARPRQSLGRSIHSARSASG